MPQDRLHPPLTRARSRETERIRQIPMPGVRGRFHDLVRLPIMDFHKMPVGPAIATLQLKIPELGRVARLKAAGCRGIAPSTPGATDDKSSACL